MSQLIITMEDCRQLHYCSKGIRKFFGRYGLDYSDFLQNGIPFEQLKEASNNDGMVLALEEVARGRQQ